MRRPARTFIFGLTIASLFGCGGGAANAGETTPSTAQGPAPCPTQNEVRLGSICWNPTGSRWHVTALAPGGEYAFDVELLPANRLRSTDHPMATGATDEWFDDGNTLRIFLQNRYVEYRTDISNGTVIVGEAQNVRGDSWTWRGDRMQVGPGCQPGDVSLSETCFALIGTQWLLRSPSGERVIHFEAEGVLLTDSSAADASNRWSQEGQRLRFTLDGVEHTAEIQSAERLEGAAGSAQWAAEIVPLYPPPMH